MDKIILDIKKELENRGISENKLAEMAGLPPISGQNAYEASGFDVFAAQRHLRHKDIRTTMRYLGIDDQRRNDINKAMVVHVDNTLKASKPAFKRT